MPNAGFGLKSATSKDRWRQHTEYTGAAFDPILSGFSADFCAALGTIFGEMGRFGSVLPMLRLYLRFELVTAQKTRN